MTTVLRITLAVGIVVTLLTASAVIVKQQIGDLRPVVLPAENSTDLTIVPGFSLSYFAKGVEGARDIAVTPEQTLLVSQPAKGQVIELLDDDQNGTADRQRVILSGLRKPHGLVFDQSSLFVAEETSVKRYSWNAGTVTFEKKLFDLPEGGRHTSRTLAIDAKGYVYVSLGSTCDVCIEKHPWIGTVIRSDRDGNNPSVYATGLRNAVFLEYDTNSDSLWSTEMGRDFLGDKLPPDEINRIQQGHFGWPHCYGDRVKDAASGISQTRAFDCASTITPAFQIPAHSAPLGLVTITSPAFPEDWQGDLLVAYHGSWNSTTPVGYKVVRLVTEGNSIIKEEDFLTGFLQGNRVSARPVDLEFDQQGTLYLSDDKAGNIYRIQGGRSTAHPLEITEMRRRQYPSHPITVKQTLPAASTYTKQVVTYQSDGLIIQALMTIPKGEKPEGGWPVVIFNHGYIPPEQYRTTEKYEAYVDAFAKNGYIVFKSDYRGHGSSEGNPEGAYYSPAYTIDVLSALASLREHPDVDPARIGMWGHSMGGNITLRSMVISPHIKAGVIWGGVVGTYEEMATIWRRSRPWSPSAREQQTIRPNRQKLVDQYGEPNLDTPFWKSISPHAYLQDLSGPLQLHHAIDDDVVPIEFSRSLSRRLQESGEEGELFEYTTGGHNISGAAFTQAMQRSLQFFTTHL